MSERFLHASESAGAKANIPDLRIVGDADCWILLSKASSDAQGFMRSTKAMNVPGGVVIQASTMQSTAVFDKRDGTVKHWSISDALVFVPGVTAIRAENVDAATLIPSRDQSPKKQRIEDMPPLGWGAEKVPAKPGTMIGGWDGQVDAVPAGAGRTSDDVRKMVGGWNGQVDAVAPERVKLPDPPPANTDPIEGIEPLNTVAVIDGSPWAPQVGGATQGLDGMKLAAQFQQETGHSVEADPANDGLGV